MATVMTTNILVKGITTPKWVNISSLNPATATLSDLRDLLIAKKIITATHEFLVDDVVVDADDLGTWTIMAGSKAESDGKRSIQVQAATETPTPAGGGTGTSTGGSTGTGTGTDTGSGSGTGTGTGTGGGETGAGGGGDDDDDPTLEESGDPDIPAKPGPLTPPTRPTPPPPIELPSVADATERLQYYADLSNRQRRWIFKKVGMYRGIRMLLKNQNLVSPGTTVVVEPRDGKTWPDAVPTSPTLAVTAQVAFSWAYHSFQKDVSHSASLGGSYKMVGLSTKYQRDESQLKIHEKTKIYMYGEYLLPKISLVLDKYDLKMSDAAIKKFQRFLNLPMRAQRYEELVGLLTGEIGAYVPLEVMVGGRLWSERESEVTNTDEMDRKVDEFGAKLSVKAKIFSISAGYGYRNEQNQTNSTSTSTEDVRLNLVGGDPAKFPEPPKWIGSLGPYKSWAPIKYAKLEPVITFLPDDLRNKFLEVMDRYAPYDPGDELIDFRAYIRDYMVPDEDDLDDR
jgi:hypothetical protein